MFDNYLKSKNIFVNHFKNNSINDPFEQIEILSDFHKRSMGYKNNIDDKLRNNIGKLIEKYKINLKRANKDLKYIKSTYPRNDFEKMFSELGESYLERAQKCIDSVYSSQYYEIIRRSMKRNEICIGNAEPYNLRKVQGIIEINDISHCAYDIVEMDACKLLGYLKRKGTKIDFDDIIQKFAEYEGLESNSVSFIKAVISYPHEVIKCCSRYRKYGESYTSDYFKRKLEKAVLKEGKSLI